MIWDIAAAFAFASAVMAWAYQHHLVHADQEQS